MQLLKETNIVVTKVGKVVKLLEVFSKDFEIQERDGFGHIVGDRHSARSWLQDIISLIGSRWIS